MKKIRQSLRHELYDYLLRHRGTWIHSGALEKYAEGFGKKGSTGSRRLRELHEEGIIHRDERKSKTSHVKSVRYSIPK